MSDETDDAPDIPAALSESEWARIAYRGARGNFSAFIDGATDGLVVSDNAEAIPIADVEQLAAVMALANEALRRFDDPRAILREHVALLRKAATEIGDSRNDERMPEERIVEFSEMHAQLHELADALDSYLPKEPQR